MSERLLKRIGYVDKMWLWLKNYIYLLVITLLFVSNFLTLADSKFHDALYGFLSKLPVSSLLQDSPTSKKVAARAKLTRVKAKVGSLGQKVTQRTLRNVAVNVSSVPVSSTPILGIGLILSVTALDVSDACNNMKDMNEMLEVLELEGDTINEAKICGMNIPSAKEIQDKLLFTAEEQKEIQIHIDGFISSLAVDVQGGLDTIWESLGGTLFELRH